MLGHFAQADDELVVQVLLLQLRHLAGRQVQKDLGRLRGNDTQVKSARRQ